MTDKQLQRMMITGIAMVMFLAALGVGFYGLNCYREHVGFAYSLKEWHDTAVALAPEVILVLTVAVTNVLVSVFE